MCVDAAERLAAELGLSSTAATILVRRGYDTPERALRFLRADDRAEPDRLSGVHEAVRSILAHVERGSPIVVHGDYDVDGVCSTAVLVRGLRRLGAQPRWLIPSRTEDGYGLTAATVARMAAEGARLVVAVDCGITSVAEVAQARALGVDVVVCDHHRPGPELPACPIVHPALGDYPYPDLCATAVAHKLVEALAAAAGLDPAGAREDLDLVGLATVADIVPLTGENRRLVREGLEALARTRKPGLRALMQVSGADRMHLDEQVLAFRLGPRINAAGRVRRADAALELVLTEDEDRAAAVADELDLLNRERRDTETRILFAAEAARAERPDAAAYVVAGEGWHAGVIGIVASRLVERHHRPCVVVALDGDSGRGSGRSISAYDLHAGLGACAEHLRRFGGHRMAAGLELDTERLEGFASAFAAHAGSVLSPDDLMSTQRVDAVVPGGALGLDLAEELARLGPFGAGNPRPTLLVPGARVSGVVGMGEDGGHARMSIASGSARARAVAFGVTPAALLAEVGEEPCDVAFTLEAREWAGTVEPRLVVRAARPSAAGECAVLDPVQELWPAFDQPPVAPAPAPDATDPARRAVRPPRPGHRRRRGCAAGERRAGAARVRRRAPAPGRARGRPGRDRRRLRGGAERGLLGRARRRARAGGSVHAPARRGSPAHRGRRTAPGGRPRSDVGGHGPPGMGASRGHLRPRRRAGRARPGAGPAGALPQRACGRGPRRCRC